MNCCSHWAILWWKIFKFTENSFDDHVLNFVQILAGLLFRKNKFYSLNMRWKLVWYKLHTHWIWIIYWTHTIACWTCDQHTLNTMFWNTNYFYWQNNILQTVDTTELLEATNLTMDNCNPLDIINKIVISWSKIQSAFNFHYFIIKSQWKCGIEYSFESSLEVVKKLLNYKNYVSQKIEYKRIFFAFFKVG